MPMRVAVAVSGRGSNLEALLRALGPDAPARVVLVLSDRADAPAVGRAAERGLAGVTLRDHADGREWLSALERHGVDLLVLAGYLKLVPAEVVARYRGRILNVHPALLPAFGGKGMYGRRVHEAVLASGARESGATVHLVDEVYDHGAILGQALGLPKFATGDLLRDAVKRGTPLGRKAQAVMEAGNLVGDDIILGVVREEVGKPEAAKGVIFDGVVRTIPQAEGLERILAEQRRKIDAVLFFDVTDEEILARLDRRRTVEGRADDDPAAVATRLRAYREQTAPVLEWYERRGGVKRIPAIGTVDEIAARVRQALGN
jgi:folate-dependent phosphoribosylglycinamide formyltransferase PurN